MEIPKCIKQNSDAILYLLCSCQELRYLLSFFQISSCCFPLDFLEFSCAFKGQPRIWGKFIHWFGDSFPLVLSFPGISLSIYSSSGSLNSVLWQPNLIKQQIFAWIIAALCHMNWKMPLGKSQINVDLTQCHLILSRVKIYHNCCLSLVVLKCFELVSTLFCYSNYLQDS